MGSATPRILWITERYPPNVGGMAVSCARQVRGLRARDVRLDVIALAEPSPTVAVKASARDGGTDYRVSRGDAPGLAEQRAWRLVQEQHAVEPYATVVGFGATLPGHVATTLAAWLGLPAVVLVRGNDFDRDWFNPRRLPFVHQALARAAAIGAVSAEKVQRIRALYPDRLVCWTPNGVDPARWELLPEDRRVRDEVHAELADDGRRVVGLFGELKFKKRIPLWLGALRDAGLVDRVGLLVVGRVDEETRQILDDPALAPRHRRLPFAPPDKLPGLYAACDFVALPSLFEGMPNVLLEAMAAGAVPIASSAGAMGQVVTDGHTGFLFAVESRDDAARATAQALELSGDALAAMKQRVKAHVAEHFTIDRELDAICALIRRAGDPGSEEAAPASPRPNREP